MVLKGQSTKTKYWPLHSLVAYDLFDCGHTPSKVGGRVGYSAFLSQQTRPQRTFGGESNYMTKKQMITYKKNTVHTKSEKINIKHIIHFINIHNYQFQT